MKPLLSLLATFILMGVAFALLHTIIVWSGASDLVALLLFAAPITGYLSFCTRTTRAEMITSAIRIYASFSGVVLAAAGLVYLIGT